MRKLLYVGVLTICLLGAAGQGIVYLNPGCSQFDDGGVCQKCSVRYYMDKNGICQPVNPNCNTYDAQTGGCLSCYSGFAIVQDTCLPEAVVSNFYDPYCNQFQGSKCIKCSFGFYFNQDNKCTQIDPNCKQFDQEEEICTTCYVGFQVSGKTCVRLKQEDLDPFCNEFFNGNCLKCSFGYYFNEENICTQIPDDCAEFDIYDRVCHRCYTGYTLLEGECVESYDDINDPNCNQFAEGVCIKCSFGFYFNQANICMKIPDDCQEFRISERRCYQCYTGYELNANNQCVKSEGGVSDPNCRKFDAAGVCEECSFGFYFNDEGVCWKIPDDCLSFSILERKCKQCYTGYSLHADGSCVESEGELTDPNCNEFESGVCVKCSFGFYFNAANICMKIPDTCKNFHTAEERCLECYVGYVLNDFNQCVESPEQVTDKYCREWQDSTCVQCSVGSFLNTDSFCQLVSPLCKTYSELSGACTSCFAGFTLIDGACQVSLGEDIDPNCNQFFQGECVKCSFRFYPGAEGICLSVSPLCDDYDQTNGQCLSCYIGFKVQDGRCVEDDEVLDDMNCATWTDGICTQCSVGSYFSESGKCMLADLLCKTFNNQTGACTSCYPAFLLQDGKCIFDQNYQDQDPFCNEFLENECIKCSEGYFFNEENLCTKASDLCETFDMKNGKCLTCYVGFLLEEGACVKDEDFLSDVNCAEFVEGHCVKCSIGFYFDDDNLCKVVSPLCKAFDPSNGKCTECYVGFENVDGKCELMEVLDPRDPNCAQWTSNNICLKCAPRAVFNEFGRCTLVSQDCATYDELTGECKSCYGGYELVQSAAEPVCIRSTTAAACQQYNEDNQCIKCAFRSYLNEDGRCESVHDLCAEFDYDNKQCIGCYSGYSLLEGQCEITEVKEGMEIENCFAYTAEGQCLECFERYWLSEEGSCEEVDVFCRDYDKSNGQCTSCYESLGFYLENGQCLS